jgi:hypothetical protein
MKHTSLILVAAVTSVLLAAGVRGPAQTTVFNDNFSSSTVDAASPAAPTPTSTDYEIASTKNAPTPSIASGHFSFGLPSTTSGFVEAQALFSSTPVALSVGDYLELTVIFTDTAGILSSSGNASASLNVGLYNSGGVAPLAGGVLLSSGLSSATTYATGGVQLWRGYVGRILESGNNSVFTRPFQNAGTDSSTNNNGNQDLLFNGAGTGTYKNPTGTQIGSSLSATTPLTAGSTYTLDYVLTLTAPNTLAISNNLYSGAGVNGANLMFSQTVVDTNPLTNSFDGLALGWRFTAGSGAASSIDVNSISVLTTAPVPEPGTIALGGLGALGFLAARRWRRG